MIKVFKKYQKLFFNMAISITICLLAINISAPAQSYNRAPKINIAVLYHLWILGTNPSEQGKGYGTAILSKAINKFKQDKVPLYLETSTDSNLKFYERKHFKLHHSLILDSETQLKIYLLKYVEE